MAVFYALNLDRKFQAGGPARELIESDAWQDAFAALDEYDPCADCSPVPPTSFAVTYATTMRSAATSPTMSIQRISYSRPRRDASEGASGGDGRHDGSDGPRGVS